MVGETLAELTSQYAQFSESETLVVRETQKSRENHLQKRLSNPESPSSQPPTPKRPVRHPGDECTSESPERDGRNKTVYKIN